MKVAAEQSVGQRAKAGREGCGRPDCACALPIGERFVLWAIRQWQHDRALPTEGSALHAGFKVAGVLDALPDFAVANDEPAGSQRQPRLRDGGAGAAAGRATR